MGNSFKPSNSVKPPFYKTMTKEIVARDYGLVNILFSWSLSDIFNENLYKQMVKEIPKSFETVTEYFSSYTYPLLEEIRTGLCSSIEIISGAPYAKVVSCVEVKCNRRSSFEDHFLAYDIKVDEWRNRKVPGKEAYRTLPGDIFVMLKSQPQSVHDLNVVAQTWVLAHVKRISDNNEDDDEAVSISFRVELSKDISLVNDDYNSLFVVHLLNLTTHKRIWNALHLNGNFKVINDILQNNLVAEDCCDSCWSRNDDYLFEKLCMEIPSRVNPSQSEAVLASLQAAQCEHKPRVQLVWGPPGTGKTKTLGTLLYFLLKKNYRVLICAPTNIAITQVAARVLELVKNNSSLEDSDGLLGNILLFGNEKRLKVGLDIDDMYLDDRVKKLEKCFSPMTGWGSCLPLLRNFLKDCVSEYNVFADNELKLREKSTDEVDSRGPIKSFVNFFRDRFKGVVKPVRQCVSILHTHLSKNFIGESNFENMKHVWELLDSFETLLLQDDLDSSKLLKTFSSSKVVDELLPLELGRRQCISALKTLHDSLSAKVSFTESMMELCFKMASLVFCTASSSYKLYSFPVELFDILVIDEAAQMKECESAIPLQLPGLRQAILFGDECQLPAMVESSISSDAGFGRSLFQRLSLLSWPKHLLNMQYRMHPSISEFPNAKFYFNQILDAPSVTSQSYERCYLPGPMYGPYSFINVSEGREELDDDGRSRRNMVEAAVVANILHNLYKAWRSSTQRLGIGIISPYAAQVVAIEGMLGKRYDKLENFAVRVNSVDGFQGGEEDIIIISTVRSNFLGSVGFISNLQRTNVALTRARHCLWVLGHEGTLLQSNSIWKTLICNAKRRHCSYNADEDKSLAKAMIDIKKELDQLDDSLNKGSILFRCARWKVLFSDNFVKTFPNLPSTRTKKSVMNLLVKLSNGWRPKKIKANPVCDSSLQIVKQYKVEGRYVICTNDITKFEGRYLQVLKIWDIVALDDVAKLVRRLDNIYGAFTDDFLSRCRDKSLEGDLQVPSSWSTSLDIVRFKSNNSLESTSASDGDLDVVNFAENSKVSESLLLMKFYALSAGTVGHLLSGADGKALDLPFEVTDEEKIIIEHSRSSFILGRSGTGKTTVLTMKLFQKEQQYHMAMEGLCDIDIDTDISIGDDGRKSEHVLRQLFVTVSPKLCYAIKQHVSQLKSFACGQSSSMESGVVDADCIDGRDQFRGVSDSFVGIPPQSYPLVITFNKFLLMLDGTFGASYFDRFRGELKLSVGENTSLRSTSLLMKRKEVTYDKFSVFYWPHFNSQLTKKLDASRVFIEIISSIKGGFQAEETNNGKLSMESYLDLSEGRASTLSRPQREIIYTIFLNYEKMKSKRGEFDLADLVNDLHRRFVYEKYDGDIIDFVYIDEVQDLTIRQIALFKYICKNVDEGFVFSGDTAQTIARGIDFRFQDVKSLFFREFLKRKICDRDHENQEKRQISPIFHLSQNFRTHAGILKLADTVIQLIYHFFPQSIDILPPETSLIFGEAPILLESGADENAIVTIFGNTENVSSNFVGFGAEQVILVRDDCVREEISNYVGKNALVLTIVECKGLEFQDVLLYNFFGSSPFTNHWRVVYEFMKENNLLDSTLLPFPDFNLGKHNVLCSELKQLYVGITRTRQRLWICENKETISKPMFDYWKKKHVVQVRQLDDSLARAMQVASSPEEWTARGKKLLAVNNYEVATMCFERAGDKYWEIYAKASGLEASADRAQNRVESLNIVKHVGELFESINEYKRAADCFYESKDYVNAGRIYHQYCGKYEIERAGECFTLSGSYDLAAQVYAKGNYFSQCLSSCTKGNMFDLGLNYIEHWKHEATRSHSLKLKNIEQEFLEKCARSHYRTGDKSGMMRFVKAFSLEDCKRTFLRNMDCLDELLNLEKDLGNFSKAADIAREKGDILLEADVLEEGGFYKEASDLFLWYALPGSLWTAGGNGWPLKHFPQREELLRKAKISAYNVEPRHFYKTVCNEILILLSRNPSLPFLKELLIMSQNQKNKRGEILVTRRILDSMLKIDFSKYEVESGLVDDLVKYSLDLISQNKVSVETLIYFWNIWKVTIFGIFKFLEVFEDNTEASDLVETGEFCFHYLGVRKMSVTTSTVYVCLFPEAKWLGNLDKRSSQKFRKLVTVDKLYLLTAARNYWSTELFSTGMKVLRILEALQNQKHNSEVSMSSFTKTRIATLIYEVSQLLLSWKYLEHNHNDSKLLQNYVDLSIEEYFSQVFPPNLSEPVSKDMILLRETDISNKIQKEIIVKNLRGRCELTSGQLGRVTMVLLGSCKDKTELHETVLKSLYVNSSHKSFFTALFECGSSNEPLPLILGTLLRDLYGANWREEKDYISPVCYLYLVDRLMISLMEFRGLLMTCRSSLVELLIHNDWKAPYVRRPIYGNDDPMILNDTICAFVGDTIHQLLVNKNETREWAKKAEINMKDYPLLLMKLVVILCLVNLNSYSGGSFDLIQDVLNRAYITNELPTRFCLALRRKNQWVINVSAIAKALQEIGDPLVQMESSVVKVLRLDSPCTDYIYLPMDNQSKEDFLRILYPRKLPEHSQPDFVDRGKHLQNRNEEFDLSKHGNVWELFSSLKLVADDDDKRRKKFVSCAPRIKDQVDKAYNLLTSATIALTAAKNTDIDDQLKTSAEDADCLLVELRLLSSALDASGEQLKGSFLLIKDIYERLMSGKAVFEYFLGPLLPPKDAKTTLVVNEEKDTGELDLDKTRKYDSLVVDPEANNSGEDSKVEESLKDTKTTLVVNEEKDTGNLHLDETQKDVSLVTDPEANNSSESSEDCFSDSAPRTRRLEQLLGLSFSVEESQKDVSASQTASGNQNANQGGKKNKGKGNMKSKNKGRKNKRKGK